VILEVSSNLDDSVILLDKCIFLVCLEGGLSISVCPVPMHKSASCSNVFGTDFRCLFCNCYFSPCSFEISYYC